VLHIFSPAQKLTYETKRKNYGLLMRSKLKITKIKHKCNSSTKQPQHCTTNTDRNGHSVLLIDKTFSPRLVWFLSQTITWLATDRNVQWKKSGMPTLVSSGGTVKWSNSVKKLTLQCRHAKVFLLHVTVCCKPLDRLRQKPR